MVGPVSKEVGRYSAGRWGTPATGVSSSTRPDPQAKGLGEYVRSRHVALPEAVLGA